MTLRTIEFDRKNDQLFKRIHKRHNTTHERYIHWVLFVGLYEVLFNNFANQRH